MQFILPLLLVFSLSLRAESLSMKLASFFHKSRKKAATTVAVFPHVCEKCDLEAMFLQLSNSVNYDDGDDLTIDENINNGKVLKLSNGTVWEVAPQDTHITEIWIFPFPLKIEKSRDPYYPYYIMNKRSKTKVLARPLTKKSAEEKTQSLPKQKIPQQKPQYSSPLSQER